MTLGTFFPLQLGTFAEIGGNRLRETIDLRPPKPLAKPFRLTQAARFVGSGRRDGYPTALLHGDSNAGLSESGGAVRGESLF